jgi:hypothetical protein
MRALRFLMMGTVLACGTRGMTGDRPICPTPPASPSPSRTSGAVGPSDVPTRAIPVGPVTLRVTISKTAQLFQIVDEMSQWSQGAHPQYRRWLEARGLLGEHEEALLSAHRKMRATGYGPLDEAFFTELDLTETVARAARLKLIPRWQIETEQKILTHFEPLLTPLLEEQQPTLLAFRNSIESESERLGQIFSDLAAFAERYAFATVPLFLIATTGPHEEGGGYNGGFMQVEVGTGARGALIHELFHLVLDRQLPAIAAAARGCGHDLDAQLLDEGMAYALSPGILGSLGSGVDELSAQVEDARKRGVPANDGSLRNHRLGLALRPLLESALVHRRTLAAFLPDACAAWKELLAEAWP